MVSSDYYGAIAGEMAGQGAEPEPPEPEQWGRCHDPDCDGPAGHAGPHYQWIPE